MAASSHTPPDSKQRAQTVEQPYAPLQETRTLEQLRTQVLTRLAPADLDTTEQQPLPQDLSPTTETPHAADPSPPHQDLPTPTQDRTRRAPRAAATLAAEEHTTTEAQRTNDPRSTEDTAFAYDANHPTQAPPNAPGRHASSSAVVPSEADAAQIDAVAPSAALSDVLAAQISSSDAAPASHQDTTSEHTKAPVDSAPSASVDAPAPRAPLWPAGTVIDGRYQLLQALGAGAWGTIWKARQKGIDRFVAVKILKQRDEPSMHKARSRFEREARLASRVRHPSAVRVLDFGHLDDQPYLVMEWLDGMSLQHFLRDCGPLPPELILDIGIGVAGALYAAHQESVIHRDLKPSNIMLVETSSGLTPVVVDFGLARTFEPTEATVTHADMIVGTPAYMSPESIRGRPLTPASDIYSLGVTFLTMLLGDNPFRGENGSVTMTNHLLERPVDTDLLTLLGCSQDFAETLLSMVAIDPENRPCAQQLQHDFRRLLDAFAQDQDTPRTAATLDSLEAHLHIQHPDASGPAPARTSPAPEDASPPSPTDTPTPVLNAEPPPTVAAASDISPTSPRIVWLLAALSIVLLVALLVLFLQPQRTPQTTPNEAGNHAFGGMESEQAQAATTSDSDAPDAHAPLAVAKPESPPNLSASNTPKNNAASTAPPNEEKTAIREASATKPTKTPQKDAAKSPTEEPAKKSSDKQKAPSDDTATPTAAKSKNASPSTRDDAPAKPSRTSHKDETSDAPAALVVTVSPPGEVFIDGTSHGLRSSLMLDDLSPGQHTIRIARDGEEKTRRVRLKSGSRHVESF